MAYEEKITLNGQEVFVKFSYFPGEPCRPRQFDPGTPEEYIILDAWIEGNVRVDLAIDTPNNKELILKQLELIRDRYEKAS